MIDKKEYFKKLRKDKDLSKDFLPEVNNFFIENSALFFEIFTKNNLILPNNTEYDKLELLNTLLDKNGRNKLNNLNRNLFLESFRPLMLFKLVKVFEKYSEEINQKEINKLSFLDEYLEEILLFSSTYDNEDLNLKCFLEIYYPKEKVLSIFDKLEEIIENKNFNTFLEKYLKLNLDIKMDKNLVIKTITYIFALVLYKRSFSETYETFGVLGGKDKSIIILSLNIFKQDGYSIKNSIENLPISIYEPSGRLNISGTKVEESIKATFEKALDYIIEQKSELKEKILSSEYIITIRNINILNENLELSGNSFDLNIILLILSSQLFGISIQLDDGICSTGEVSFESNTQKINNVTHEEDKILAILEYNKCSYFGKINSFYYPFSNNNFQPLFEKHNFIILKEPSSESNQNSIYLKKLFSFDDLKIIDHFTSYITKQSSIFENIDLKNLAKDYSSIKDFEANSSELSKIISENGIIIPSFISEEPEKNAVFLTSFIAKERKNAKVFKTPIPVIISFPEILKSKIEILTYLKKYFRDFNILDNTIESYFNNKNTFVFVIYDKNFNKLQNSFRGETFIENLLEKHYILFCSNSIEQSNYFKNYINKLEIKLFNQKMFYKYSNTYRNVEETSKIITSALNIPFEIYKEKTKNNNFESFLESFYNPKEKTSLPHYIPLKLSISENIIDTKNLYEYFEELAKIILESDSALIYLYGSAGSGKTSTFLSIIKKCLEENNSFRNNMFLPCYLKMNKSNYENIDEIFFDTQNLLYLDNDSLDKFLGYSLPILFFIDQNLEKISQFSFEENIKNITLKIEMINQKFNNKHRIIILYRTNNLEPKLNSINAKTLINIKDLDIEVSKEYILRVSDNKSNKITSFLDKNIEILKTPLFVDFINWICVKTNNEDLEQIDSTSAIYQIFTRENLRNERKNWNTKDLFTWVKYQEDRDRLFDWDEEKFSMVYNEGKKYYFEKNPHPVEIILMILAKEVGTNFIDTKFREKINILIENEEYLWLHEYRFIKNNLKFEKRINNSLNISSNFPLLKKISEFEIEFLHPSFSDYYYAKSIFYDLKKGNLIDIENKEFYEKQLNEFNWKELDIEASISEKKTYQSNLLKNHTFESLIHFINLFEREFNITSIEYETIDYFLSLNISKTALFYLAKAYETYFYSNLNYNTKNPNEINNKDLNQLFIDYSVSLYHKSLETKLLENEEEKDYRTFNNLGNIYKSAELYEDAEICYKEGIKINNDFEALHFNLGIFYFELNNYEEAILSFNESVRIIPNGIKNNWALSVCYANLGNVEQSIKYLKILISKISKEDYKNYLETIHKILKEKIPNYEKIEATLIESLKSSTSSFINNTSSFIGKGVNYLNSFFVKNNTLENNKIIVSENKNNGIRIIIGDITSLDVDAIINPANTSLIGFGGLDGLIHRAAGSELTEECKKLNGCKTGESKITSGYKLVAKNIIHTVGPIWHGGDYNETELLANCYKNSLKLATENNIKTIAFPSISTGNNYFPLEKAVKIAINEIKEYQKNNPLPEEIIICCFDTETYNAYISEMNSYFI